MLAEVLGALPQWRRTGHTFFPYAAFVDGRWWVLRFNCFPDHPLWTLFIADRRRFDFDDEPTGWGSAWRTRRRYSRATRPQRCSLLSRAWPGTAARSATRVTTSSAPAPGASDVPREVGAPLILAVACGQFAEPDPKPRHTKPRKAVLILSNSAPRRPSAAAIEHGRRITTGVRSAGFWRLRLVSGVRSGVEDVPRGQESGSAGGELPESHGMWSAGAHGSR